MTCCGPKDVELEARGTGTNPKLSLEEERLRASSQTLKDGIIQSDFHVPGMHCASCISKIERKLGSVLYVSSARANLSTRRVSVVWDGDAGQARDLHKAIEDAGFEADIFDLGSVADETDKVGNQLLMSLGVAGFAAANIMLLSVSVWSGADGTTRQLFHLISALIAIPAVAFAGRPFFRSALGALKKRQLNMDVPISLAVLLSLFMSVIDSLKGREHVFFDASVMLLFFLLIGRYLDHRMRERARGAVSRLSRMTAKGAAVLDEDGVEQFLPLGEITPGMMVVVRPGERVPIDGVIEDGTTDLDRSLVTGESDPVAAMSGVSVEAGTVNLTGPIGIKVTKTADQSFLAEVTSMMEAAEQGKAKVRRIADSMARIYAPAVHLLALFAFLFWLVASGGDWHLAIYIAISVLIITCPCALGLAVPIVHVVAAGQMFKRGILVKDGAVFEKLGRIDRVVFDKTGTLTLGRPTITSSSGPVGDFGPVAAALASASTHPAAKAVSSALDEPLMQPSNVSSVTEYPGLGLEGDWNGKTVRLGRRDWVEEIASPNTPSSQTSSVLEPAETTVSFAVRGCAPLIFTMRDQLRPDAEKTIAGFKARGLKIEILSGDNRAAVQAIADQLGVSDWHADQRPADKVKRIEALSSKGSRVLVVGDGINDAPALAAAYVSIAPSSGSDVGRLAADLVFTGSSLGVLLPAQNIAKMSDRLVKQNFAIAIAYNCIAVPLAFMGFVTPLVAAIAMSGSSIVVVANSLRLNLTPREDMPQTSSANPPDPKRASGSYGPARPDAIAAQ